jgi:hypothetical protein
MTATAMSNRSFQPASPETFLYRILPSHFAMSFASPYQYWPAVAFTRARSMISGLPSRWHSTAIWSRRTASVTGRPRCRPPRPRCSPWRWPPVRHRSCQPKREASHHVVQPCIGDTYPRRCVSAVSNF